MVPRCLHVRDALRGDPILRRVPGRNVRENHEPQRLLRLPSRYDHTEGMFLFTNEIKLNWDHNGLLREDILASVPYLKWCPLVQDPRHMECKLEIHRLILCVERPFLVFDVFENPQGQKTPQNSRKTQGFDKAPRFEAQSLAYNSTFVL